MSKHILSVRGAVPQSAQHWNERWMQIGDSDLGHCILRRTQTLRLDLALAPLMHLLDASGMYSPVGHQLSQGHAGGFSPYRFKVREQHRFRCVINHDVHAGDLLECPHVAAFSTNDSAFHIVARKMDRRNNRLRSQLGGETLYGSDNDLLRPRICLAIRLTFDVSSK